MKINASMTKKIMTITVGGIALSSTALILFVSHLSEEAMTEQALANLNGLTSARALQVVERFKQVSTDIKNISDSKFIQDALVSYESVANGTGLDLEQDSDISKNTYIKNIETKYSESFAEYLNAYPLNSFALVLNNGFVPAQAGDQTLVGKNLKLGTLKNSPLTECLKSAEKDGSHFTGIVQVATQPQILFCQKIKSKYDRDGYSKNANMGFLITRLDWNIFASLRDATEGLGQSGEMFLFSGDQFVTPPRKFAKMDLAELLQKSLKSSVPDETQSLVVTKKLELNNQIPWTLKARIDRSEALASVSQLKIYSYGILLLSIFAAVLGSWIIVKSITRGFLLAGDQINNSSKTISNASEQFQQITDVVAQGNQKMSSSLEETSATMEQISTMVTKTRDLSKNSKTKSESGVEKAMSGESKMNFLVDAVDKMGQATATSFELVKTSSENSLKEFLVAFQNVELKTKVINEIAFQTKLLSFNASVEAARAGEHGKGFSVVAGEIGQLAKLVETASKEINHLIVSTTQRVDQISIESKELMDRAISSTEAVTRSTGKQANEGLHFFKELASLVNQISNEVSEVSSASDEQASGVSAINSAILNISDINKNTTSLVVDLERQTRQLTEATSELRSSSHEMSMVINGRDIKAA